MRGIIMRLLKHSSTEFEYFTPKWLSQLSILAYIFIYDMNYHCAKLHSNIHVSTNFDTTYTFQFLAIFAQNFYYFTPKKQIMTLFSLASLLISLVRSFTTTMQNLILLSKS